MNLYHARQLKASLLIQELRAPLISVIRQVLERGQALGVLRRDVDPVELYVSICALGYFVLSNQHTLGTISGIDLMGAEALARRRKMIVDMVTAYLGSGADRHAPDLGAAADAEAKTAKQAGRKRAPRAKAARVTAP